MSMTIQSSVKDKILATSSETSKVKANVVIEALSRKERVKPRRVRAMAMTIQYGVRGMILTAQSEAFKQENVPLVGSEWSRPMTIKTLEDIMRACVIDFGGSYQLSIRCAPFEALYGRKCRSPVLWAEIGESSLIGPELVQETTDKVFEVGDRVMLKVSPWKGVIRFGKKACSLDEIEVDKILCFVEEPVKNSDYEVMSKGSLGVVVEVRFLTSLLDDGRGSGSWMFLFVWSGYAAMRTLLWAGKVVSSSYIVESSWNSKSNFVLTLEIIRDDDEPQNESPNDGEGTTTKGLTVEYFDTFPTRDELTYHKSKNLNNLNPSKFLGPGWMLLLEYEEKTQPHGRYLGSIIDSGLSEVVLGKPFAQTYKLTYDESLGLIRFAQKNDEVVFRVPQRTKELDLVIFDEKKLGNSYEISLDDSWRMI
ncbi:hypothetical protein Tco_0799223 [Tanacetum coccineum]